MDVQFLCLTSEITLLLCCAEAVGARLTSIWFKDTLVGCGTATEVSDLNSLSCGNSVPNQFFKPVTILAIYVI